MCLGMTVSMGRVERAGGTNKAAAEVNRLKMNLFLPRLH